MEKIKALIALGLITEADVFDYYHELERIEIDIVSKAQYDDDYESL